MLRTGIFRSKDGKLCIKRKGSGMWKQILKNKGLILVSLIALAAGCALGVLVGLAIQAEEPETEPAGRIGVAAILPTTRMERRIAFQKCGHAKTDVLDAAAFVGYTKEELASFYQMCEVEAFSGERVVLTQRLDACCPDHVLLKARSDGTLSVYQTDAEFFIEQLIRVLTLDPEATIAADELSALQSGMVFDTLSDVDAYLESLES